MLHETTGCRPKERCITVRWIEIFCFYKYSPRQRLQCRENCKCSYRVDYHISRNNTASRCLLRKRPTRHQNLILVSKFFQPPKQKIDLLLNDRLQPPHTL